jgi:hypothetical protein
VSSASSRTGDPLLRVLAAGVALPEHQIGITLSVGGAVLTGLLVTRDRWLAELAAYDRGARPGALAQIVGIIHEGELAGSPVLDDMGDFLHLTLVRVVGRPAEVPQMWRVRIGEVAGWGLGHSTDETQEFRRAQPRLPAEE